MQNQPRIASTDILIKKFLGGGPMAFNARTVLSKHDDGPVIGVSFIILYSS